MLEKEIKLMLTRSEYELLEKTFDFSSEIVQKNNYYRSSACAEKRISVRVRELGGKKLLQVKLPVSSSGSLDIREELERELDSVPQVISSELLSEICGIEDEAVFIGALVTKRSLCYDYENVELALDKNEYLGMTDYELEAEYTGEYPEGLTARLKELEKKKKKAAFGKYSRFCKRLAEVTDYGTTF